MILSITVLLTLYADVC